MLQILKNWICTSLQPIPKIIFVCLKSLNHDKEIKNATKLKDTFRCVLVCKKDVFYVLAVPF